MARNARPAREPAGVLVVTVWSEEGGLRRVVSLTDPEPHGTRPALDLRRTYAANNAAVLDLVKTWLEAVEDRGRGAPPLRGLRVEPGGDATVTRVPRCGDASGPQ